MSIQVFNKDQLHHIQKGADYRVILRNHIDEALNRNKFKRNYILSSLPGLGKTHEMEQAVSKLTNEPVIMRGDGSPYNYFIDLATAMYLNGGADNPLTVINDDCDILFNDKNINVTKNAFNNSRLYKYAKNYTTLKPLCSDVQWAALEYFADATKAGIELDVSNVTFIILTNMHLQDVHEVSAQEPGSTKYEKYNNRYAIRRRTQYKEIDMPTMDLWGYVADVVLNEQICEKFIPNISKGHKEQILQWLYTKWENDVTEQNLSIVEKMTMDIANYPNDYLDIWELEYVR